MNGYALGLVLAGALMHALWNYFAKLASGGRPFVWLYGLISSVLSLLVVALAPGVSFQIPEGGWPTLLLISGISAVLHILYSISLQVGYKSADLSIVYPVARGTGPLCAVVGAVCFLGEQPSAFGLVGILVIIFGIVVISGIKKISPHRSDGVLFKGVKWGFVTGFFIASYTILDGWAVKVLQMNPIVFYATSLWIRTLLLTPFVMNDVSVIKEQWKNHRVSVLAVGVLSPFAYVLTLYALTLAPLSYVAPAREVSMLFGMFFAARLLSEENVRARLIGAFCIACGIIILGVA